MSGIMAVGCGCQVLWCGWRRVLSALRRSAGSPGRRIGVPAYLVSKSEGVTCRISSAVSVSVCGVGWNSVMGVGMIPLLCGQTV